MQSRLGVVRIFLFLLLNPGICVDEHLEQVKHVVAVEDAGLWCDEVDAACE